MWVKEAALVGLAVLLGGCDSAPFPSVNVDLVPAARRAAPPAAGAPAHTLRFSVAAIESPRDTYSAYSRLFGRLGNRLGKQVEFVQRRTYREVNDLLKRQEAVAAAAEALSEQMAQLVAAGAPLPELERLALDGALRGSARAGPCTRTMDVVSYVVRSGWARCGHA